MGRDGSWERLLTKGRRMFQRLLDALHLVKRGAVGVGTGVGFQFLESLPASHGVVVMAAAWPV